MSEEVVNKVIQERLGNPRNLDFICNQINYENDAIIEASAGTGKTYTLQSIVLKLVHEKKIDSVKNILLVTFTEKAAGELRDRIRDILEKADCLPADFDEVSICTIHSFCRQLLAEYAFENRVPMETELGGSDKQLIHQAVLEALHSEEFRNRFGARFGELMTGSGLSTDNLIQEVEKIFRQMEDLPETSVKSTGRGKNKTVEVLPNGKAILLNALRAMARKIYEERKNSSSAMSFDDLVNRAHEIIVSEAKFEESTGRKSTLLESIRHKYRIALVDEFQDTDAKQWDIFRSIFSCKVNQIDDGPKPQKGSLLVVGDPKQAIYSFRGADIKTYLDAKKIITDSGVSKTLDTTYRSSPDLVKAFNTIFGGKVEPDHSWFEDMTEGTGSIAYAPVKSDIKAKKFNEIKYADAFDGSVGLLESLPWPQKFPKVSKAGYGNKAVCLSMFLRNAAREMKRLKSLPWAYRTEDPDNGKEIRHPFSYRDMCILVRSHAEAVKAQEILTEAKIPFSIYTERGLYASAEAEALLVLFDFLSAPSRHGRLEALLLTPLFGYRPNQLEDRLGRDDPAFTALMDAWQGCILKKAWSQLFESVMNDTQLAHPRRDDSGFDRRWSATRQILDRLHDEVGPHAQTIDEFADELRAWRKNDERAGENGALRNKETEADCVQIMTMHVSKGLEFPVVFVAYGFGPLGHTADDKDAAIREEKRLLYVALTRAEHKLYLPWSQWAQHERIKIVTDKKTKEKKESREKETGIGSVGSALLIPKDPETGFGFLARGIRAYFGSDEATKKAVIESTARLREFAEKRNDEPGASAREENAVQVTEVSVYEIDADGLLRQHLEIDSYSSVHKRAQQMSEPVDSVVREDETPVEEQLQKREPTLLPRNNISGDVFHEIMETLCNNDDSDGRELGFCTVGQVAFGSLVAAPDTALLKLIVKTLRKHQIVSQKNEKGDTTELALARMVWHALNVPIVIGGKSFYLKDVPSADRRAELEFVVNRAMMLGDALASEADPHRDNAFNGKIDLLVRPEGKDGPVYVLDWKTNSLPDFRAATLERTMTAADYHLQYRFYSQAVRYWLQDSELGGVAYLFVRAGEKCEKSDGDTGVFVAKAEDVSQASCCAAIKDALK